jgi:hypothetical protein
MQKKTLENKTQEISIGIPPETLEVLEMVARRKGLPLKALLKFYVGQGLRQDLSEEESKELALKRLKSGKDTVEKQEIDLAA